MATMTINQFNYSLDQHKTYSEAISRYLELDLTQPPSFNNITLESVPVSFKPYLEHALSLEGVGSVVKTIFKKIWEAMKFIWDKIIGFFKKIGKFFSWIGKKVKNVKDIFTDKKVIASKAVDYVMKEGKKLVKHDVGNADELQERAGVVAYAWNRSEIFDNSENMKPEDVMKRLKKLYNSDEEVINFVDIIYKVNKEGFDAFGFNPNCKICHPDDLKELTRLSAGFLALGDKIQQALSPKTLTDIFLTYCKSKTKFDTEEFRNAVCEKIMENIEKISRVKTEGNITSNAQLVYKSLLPKDAFAKSKNKVKGLEDAIKALLPNVEKADQDKVLGYRETMIGRGRAIDYLKSLDGVLVNFENDRRHLFDGNGGLKVETYTIDEYGMEKLMNDAGIYAKGSNPEKIAKEIGIIVKACSQSIHTVYAFWLSLSSHIVKHLNRQLNEMHKFEPIVPIKGEGSI